MEKQPKPTIDIPAAEAKAEGQKLEWGPYLGRMKLKEIEDKINELNNGLSEEEKPWRLPTADEILEQFRKVKVQNPDAIPVEQKNYWIEGYYWTGTKNPHKEGSFYLFGARGFVIEAGPGYKVYSDENSWENTFLVR